MNKITKEMRDQLRAPLPPEAVKPHPTKTYLSSIKPIYVVERINDVFGVGSWKLETDMVERSDKGTVVVKSSFSIPEYDVYLESFGGNDNGGEDSKNFDLGDAFKGATTDSLTKIASYLEIGIDVFKGSKSAKKAPEVPETTKLPKTETKALPWLNPTDKKNWSYTQTRLSEGMPIEKVKEAYRISKENEALLLKLVSEGKTLVQ